MTRPGKSIVVLAATAALALLIGAAELRADDAAPSNHKPYSKGPAKCSGKILLKMGEHALLIDRLSSMGIEIEGWPQSSFKVDREGIPYGCDVKKIDGVAAIKSFDLRVVLLTPEQIAEASRQNKEKVEEFKKLSKENGVTTIGEGVEKASSRAFDYYLFSLDKAPTFGEVSIVMDCSRPLPEFQVPPEISTNTCRASYVHPSGLAMRYAFFRKKYAEGDYLRVDLDKRKQLEAMLAAGKAAVAEKTGRNNTQ